MDEFQTKQGQLANLLDQHHLDAILLQRVSTFAWATCGAASYINTAATFGGASLLVTRDKRYLITNNIEAERLDKEARLKEQGWDFRVTRWHEPNAIAELTRGTKFGADWGFPNAHDLTAEFVRLRANPTPVEQERLRALAKNCAEAMNAAIYATKPGMSEYEIAGILGREAQARGAQPIVNLIATDERVWAYRHPLPTQKKLDRYAMLVLSARQAGMLCSITRLVHFGKLSDELQIKERACATVDAAVIAATRPGKTLGEIFNTITDAYAANGFANEWQMHHQGGASGYEPREYLATPGSKEVVGLGQAYAWNPSIAGVKSEDTIQVGEKGNTVLTLIPGWPLIEITVGDQSLARPRILEI
jgi:Xaa-Pro aminopeptidase